MEIGLAGCAGVPGSRFRLRSLHPLRDVSASIEVLAAGADSLPILFNGEI